MVCTLHKTLKTVTAIANQLKPYGCSWWTPKTIFHWHTPHT